MAHLPKRKAMGHASTAGADGDGGDPVVDAYRVGIDRSLLREYLKLSPAEQFEKHERATALFDEMRKAGERFRAKRSQG